jgi:hypothetical protein
MDNSNPEIKHTETSTSGNRVLFTIFAGRKRYLSILKLYLDSLLKLNTITEVHLWDYCIDKEDSEYLKSICLENPRYIIKTPEKIYSSFNYYYYYYSVLKCNDEDILIKCDDDIVYIDIEAMSYFIKEIKSGGIYYPNIVNNDICAYIQQQHNIHNLFDLPVNKKFYGDSGEPFTNWYQNTEKAIAIHTLFLKDTGKFKIHAPNIPFKGRISINMFGGNFRSIRGPFKKLHETDLMDEIYMAHKNYVDNNTYTFIVPILTISHFSFRFQTPDILDSLFLKQYRELAETQGSSFLPLQ